MPGTPSMLDYKVHAESGSMSNTPATYAWYIAGLVFQWLKAQGALAGIEKKNIAKAKLLYDFLDSSAFFKNPVRKSDRSRMNIPFTLADSKLDGEFLKGAEARGMVQLKGHRAVGGMRASIYNAMPIEGVKRLVEYMRGFQAKGGWLVACGGSFRSLHPVTARSRQSRHSCPAHCRHSCRCWGQPSPDRNSGRRTSWRASPHTDRPTASG